MRTTIKLNKSNTVRKLSRAQLAMRHSLRNKDRFKAREWLHKIRLSEGKRKTLRKVMLSLGLVASVVLLIGTVFFFNYLQQISAELPSPDEPFKEKPLATEIYDRKGRLLHRVYNEYNSDKVDIDSIPQSVRWAFLAAEDSDFYDHPGFDVQGIIRCGLDFLRNGRASCGGSTITQQSLKITTLYKEVGVERKLKEVIYALQVERLYNKEEILQVYLTVAPFGSNIYGITSASSVYFNKKPGELTLAQALILAGIINDPVRFSPTLSNNPKANDQVIERALWALDQLSQKRNYINAKTKQITASEEDESKRVTEDWITDELITKAREELQFAKDNKDKYYKERQGANRLAGHFVDYVLEQLRARPYKQGESFKSTDLQNGGYKVYTTLDYDMQQTAEKYVKYGYDTYTRKRGAYNAALVTLQPATGHVLAMVGSRDFNGKKEQCGKDGKCKFDPQVNVLNTLQSVGSSMKMMGYYIAYNEGILYPGSIVADVPVEWGSYKPKNVDNQFWGLNTGGSRMTTAQAMLRHSRNLPALQVLDSYGVGKFVETAKAFGYTSITNDNTGRSVILGGTDVYPIEHAQAFGVFANGGEFVQHEVVTKIVDRNDQLIYEQKIEKKRVADPQGVYLLNASTNNQYDQKWDGRNFSSKTGTTEFQRDLVYVMYSPDFVTMGWVGNSDNTPLTSRDSFGSTTVQPWVTDYMKDIGDSVYFKAKTPYSRPGGIVNGGGICKESDCKGSTGVVSTIMIADRKPKADQEYGTFTVCKDQPDRLARQIDKDTGFAEERRITVFKHFKSDLQGWWDRYLEKANRPNKFPTEECNVNRNPGGGSSPWTILSSPTSNAVIGSSVRVAGNAFTNTSGSITGVTAFIDNVSIGSLALTGNAFDATFSVPANLDHGIYKFRVNVSDSTGGSSSNTIDVVVNDETSPNLSVVTPTGNVNYNGVTPITITRGYTGPASLGATRVFISKNGGGFTEVGTMSGGILNWSPTHAAGVTDNYQVYLVANANNTGVMQSEVFNFQVTGI